MKKMLLVKLIKDTSTTIKGALRELNPERAAAWVKAGWAEYAEKPRFGKKTSENNSHEEEK